MLRYYIINKNSECNLTVIVNDYGMLRTTNCGYKIQFLISDRKNVELIIIKYYFNYNNPIPYSVYILRKEVLYTEYV